MLPNAVIVAVSYCRESSLPTLEGQGAQSILRPTIKRPVDTRLKAFCCVDSQVSMCTRSVGWTSWTQLRPLRRRSFSTSNCCIRVSSSARVGFRAAGVGALCGGFSAGPIARASITVAGSRPHCAHRTAPQKAAWMVLWLEWAVRSTVCPQYKRRRQTINSCDGVGLSNSPSRAIWAGDSGGVGQHLPQCMVSDPETLWRWDAHEPWVALNRVSSSSYWARSASEKCIVPLFSNGSASTYGRWQPGHGAPARYCS